MRWYTKTKPKDIQGLIIDEETGRNVAVSYDPKDAALIAAAPKLLNALEEVIDVAIECDPRIRDLIGRERVQIARQAIREAKGEA
jgi:hypothetical protein